MFAMASNNTLYLIGAAALNIGVFIVEHYRNRQATIRYLEKVEQQLADIQAEIKQLWLLQDKKLKNSNDSANCNSCDDNSSDSEFYEFSDDEDLTNTAAHLDKSLYIGDQTLKELDVKLNTPSTQSIKDALNYLVELNQDFPRNTELLWRMGEAHQKLALATDDKAAKLELIDKGLAACELALELNPNSSHVHKWYGMLVGARSELQPLMAKIKDATLFKKHIDVAFDLNPNDGFLHYVLARFVYETANMSWYERKAASVIFENLPMGSFEEALQSCLKAEQLLNGEFKDNKLVIAKCQIALGKYADAVRALMEANMCGYDSLDSRINTEIDTLLKKYSSYV